jgi:putative tryptophan/tyrosine transport system substrate-binding protein
MRRRDFLGIAGGAVLMPLAARAQQTTPTVIGVLNGQSAEGYARNFAELRKGLSENGYIEGQNLTIEYRWGDGHEDRLPGLAADLVQRQVAAIMCSGSPTATLAAKSATSTIPIVFSTGIDPVKAGYVQSLNRPGGNVTGVSFLAAQLNEKRLGLFHELLPSLTTLAALVNVKRPTPVSSADNIENAARSMGSTIHILPAGTDGEIDAAFEALPGLKADGLLVGADPFFLNNRSKIVALAAHYAVPTIYELREFVDDGGLMSYGTSITEAYHQAGSYLARILKGEKPADLPVVQSTKFDLIINLKTAKALGLTVPPNLLTLADEVIE